jgi:hypothetical protein
MLARMVEPVNRLAHVAERYRRAGRVFTGGYQIVFLWRLLKAMSMARSMAGCARFLSFDPVAPLAHAAGMVEGWLTRQNSPAGLYLPQPAASWVCIGYRLRGYRISPQCLGLGGTRLDE